MARCRYLLALLVLPALAWTQENGQTAEDGRWIPAGTFALSNLPATTRRDRTYARGGEESSRLLTFLPGMTIVYKIENSKTRPGYVEGVTQSGIPVRVMEADLSTGKFGDRSAKDVVIHRSHEGCRDVACLGDSILLGIGDAFTIVAEGDKEIELVDTNELRIYYPTSTFLQKEKSGHLTRHKGRKNPRWSLSDGYAWKWSAACGQTRSAKDTVKVLATEYASDPLTWGVDDPRWSLKAIEIFGLGETKLEGDSYIGTLVADISRKDDEAIDLTVFAYRDSSWRPDYAKFAGLLQIVACDTPPIGSKKPTYVKDAYLYFDKKEGDGYVQDFPLQDYQLKRLLSESEQAEIFRFTGRSFFYSINSATEHERVFDALSEIIPYPAAVANVIARLNASCSESDRKQCRKHSGSQLK